MDERTLEINVISARGLEDVNSISKMDVYAVVSISGEDSKQRPKQKTKTPTDRAGGKNPLWNFSIKFTIPETPLAENRLNLVFKLKCDWAFGDKDIGEVNVPIKELLDSAGDGKSMKFVSYQVREPSGKPKGEVTFSFKFSDIETVMVPGASASSSAMATNYSSRPVTAYYVGPSPVPYGGPGSYQRSPLGYGYPPPPPDGGYQPRPPPGYGCPPPYGRYQPPPSPGHGSPPPRAGYQPPQPGYGCPPPYGGYQPLPPQGFGYLPPPGYGYPPVQAGYGYPPPMQVRQPAMMNNFPMRVVATLLERAVGGLLMGDMVFDAASYDGGYDAASYDGGYDAGYDAASYDGGYDAGYDAASYDGGYDGGFDDAGGFDDGF